MAVLDVKLILQPVLFLPLFRKLQLRGEEHQEKGKTPRESTKLCKIPGLRTPVRCSEIFSYFSL